MNDIAVAGQTKRSRAYRSLAARYDVRLLRRLYCLVMRSLVADESAAPRYCVRAAIVDTETTLSSTPEKPCIKAIGLLIFDFDPATGSVAQVLHSVSLQPSAAAGEWRVSSDALPSISGLVSQLDISEMMQGVQFVISHNAEFDRPRIETAFPLFAVFPWTCSLREINWRNEGMGSCALDYLLMRQGYFHDHHQAEIDCHALLKVLIAPLPRSTRMPLNLLHARSQAPDIQLMQPANTWHGKKLKSLGFRYTQAGWQLIISRSELPTMLTQLRPCLPAFGASVNAFLIRGNDRFSNRSGVAIRLNLAGKVLPA